MSEVKCAECHGQTVQFRGSGSNLEYRICTKHEEPGHLSRDEIKAAINRMAKVALPSGRFA